MQTKKINKELFDSYSDDIPNFMKKIYAMRNVIEEELDLSLTKLKRPNFKSINIALSLLKNSIIKQKNILIVGDFDTDGATATAVVIKSLNMMGAKYVDFICPNRIEHGYGLSEKIVKLAIKTKNPDLLITVDNGISSFDGVKLAKENGINVIITDHHLPPNKIPQADVIINPNMPDCCFESKNISGVGVAFYLMKTLNSYLYECSYYQKNNIQKPDLRILLDLVALGTIADMVCLDYNNRILVNFGLKLIRSGNCNLGILAILKIANIKFSNIQSQDLGFYLAPRINAAGRLHDISLGIKCLLAQEPSISFRYARQLEEYNNSRKEIQASMQDDLSDMENDIGIENNFGICVYKSDWHSGIVGLIANKLKDTYQKPAIAFANEKDNILKGSARSINGIHIKNILDDISNYYPYLIISFGGHAGAAGLSIDNKYLKEFIVVFDKIVQSYVKKNNILPKLFTDGVLEDEEISLDNAMIIENNGPWGIGFDLPLFQGEFNIIKSNILSKRHLKLFLELKNTKRIIESIIFNYDFNNKPLNKINMTYRLCVNRYLGKESLQLIAEKIF